MIEFKLRCHDAHSFEVWFKDDQACETQSKIGLVECPYCGSTKITKAPRPGEDHIIKAERETNTHVRAHEVAQQILEAVGKLKDYAEENFDKAEPDKQILEASDKDEAVNKEAKVIDEEPTDLKDLP